MDDKDKLAKAKKKQEERMMKFDVQPPVNAKEQTVIKKAKKTWTDKSKEIN